MENVPSWAIKLIQDVGELAGTTRQILDQTTKTNGRVSGLEYRVDNLESKNDILAGAKAIKKTFSNACWDVSKFAIGALIGGGIGLLFK